MNKTRQKTRSLFIPHAVFFVFCISGAALGFRFLSSAAGGYGGSPSAGVEKALPYDIPGVSYGIAINADTAAEVAATPANTENADGAPEKSAQADGDAPILTAETAAAPGGETKRAPAVKAASVYGVSLERPEIIEPAAGTINESDLSSVSGITFRASRVPEANAYIWIVAQDNFAMRYTTREPRFVFNDIHRLVAGRCGAQVEAALLDRRGAVLRRSPAARVSFVIESANNDETRITDDEITNNELTTDETASDTFAEYAEENSVYNEEVLH